MAQQLLNDINDDLDLFNNTITRGETFCIYTLETPGIDFPPFFNNTYIAFKLASNRAATTRHVSNNLYFFVISFE